MKKNIIKNFSLSLALLSAMTMSPVFASEKVDNKIIPIQNDEVTLSQKGGISTYAMMSYSRSITKKYKNYADIPKSIYYSETIAGVKCGGNLFIDNIKLKSGYYYVLYKGDIVGNS